MQPGICLGDRYVVGERLGGGAHGSVWTGHDTVLDRPVRVKVLDADLARDETTRARFRRTALAVAELDVDGIAEVYDCVEERDGDEVTLCQIGERVEGEPLRTILRTRRLDPQTGLSLVSTVARTLHAAHQRGLSHLNLKSSNVIVTDDEVRIVDFGFQEPGDVAEDVYGLGALAYECLTGARPFEVEPDAPQVVRDRQPQPLPATLDPAIAAFVRRALSRKPAERFTTALRVADECEQLNHTHDVLGALLERRGGTVDEPESLTGLGSRLEAALVPVAGADDPESGTEEPVETPTAESPVVTAQGPTEPEAQAVTASEPVESEAASFDDESTARVAAAVPEPAEAATEPESAADLKPDEAVAEPEPIDSPPIAPVAEPAEPRRRKRFVLVAALALLLALGGAVAAVSLPSRSGDLTDSGQHPTASAPDGSSTSPAQTGSTGAEPGDTESSASAADSPSGSDESSSAAEPGSPDDAAAPAKVRVPNVVGDNARSAYSELRDAGFEVNVLTSGRGDKPCPVHAQSPGGGTSLKKGSTVDMSVRLVRNGNQCDGGGNGGGDDDGEDRD